MTEHEVDERAVVVESRSSFAIIRFNRPAERNPLSIATLEELERAVHALIARTDLKAIIFTGTGDVFASGANIRELRTLTRATAKEFSTRGQHLFQKIADAQQLTIAAINGYCMGGALDLALSCDVRCASPNAVFAHPALVWASSRAGAALNACQDSSALLARLRCLRQQDVSEAWKHLRLVW